MAARFLVIDCDRYDLMDSEVIGCGVAFPDHIEYELPKPKSHGKMDTVGQLLGLLRLSGNDIRVVWVDGDPTDLPRTESGSPPVTTSNGAAS